MGERDDGNYGHFDSMMGKWLRIFVTFLTHLKEAVLLHFIVKSFASDAKQVGRHLATATAFGESANDKFSLGRR